MTSKELLENKYYSSAMLLIVFSYALLDIAFHKMGNIFLGLILIGSIPLLIVHKNKIFKEPIAIIFILILIVQTLSWINSLIYMPEFANAIPKLDRLGKLFVFFFIAYWLKGSIKNITFLWLFFIFGFILAIVINVDIKTIFELGMNQQRVDLSIKNAQWDSMLAGTSLLMTLSMFYLTIKSSKFSQKLKISLLIGLFILVLLFTYLVLITQSRQVWLGLISVLTIGPIIYLIIHKITNLRFLLISFLITIGILFLFSNSAIVQERIAKEQNVVSSIFNSNKPIEMSSIGVRINSWLDAADWIQRHPIIGLDSEAIPEVIQQSKRFNDNLKKIFGHLHNFFIESLVAYGFIGLFLILALYYFIIKGTQTSSLSENEKKYYLFVSICFTIYWLIINNFESFNSRHLGIFTHNIIFSVFYTFHITNYLKEDIKS